MARDWSTLLERGSANSSSSPPIRDILETFIPGYRALFTLLDQAFGIDISLVISICGVIFAIVKFWSFITDQIYVLAKATILSEISFDSDDEIYTWLMDWIKKQPLAGRTGRNLIAKAGLSPDLQWRRAAKDKKSLRDPPDIAYEPSMGTHYFWFQKRLYRFSQWTPRESRDNPWRPSMKFVQATLSCLGRNADPIRALLLVAATEHFDKMASKTSVFRPYPKSVRQNAGRYWTEVTSRPSRSMDTVIFDSQQKSTIIADMDEYLQPETMTWYADHGIPYRRGYLFYGPPGTGKSSLSFALAGHFRLPLYCLSLQEPTMTEEDLASLFDALPRQCIAVLEDVDCAGLVVREVSEKDKSGPVSLSGLLNIIDGVASKEGRVLIMTTNRIDALDAALIRPGRVDLKVEFKLASQDDARRLFEGMYDENNSILSSKFAKEVPQHHLSAAEIQGYLLMRKGNPKVAVKDAKCWVSETLATKEEAKIKAQLAAEEQKMKDKDEPTATESKDDSTQEQSKEVERTSPRRRSRRGRRG